MKIRIHDPILNFKNEPLKQTREQDGKEVEETVTILDVMMTALNNPTAPGEVRTAEDKHKAYQLGKKIYESKDEVELTLDDRSYLKDRIDKMQMFQPLVVGRMGELLEDKPGDEKKAGVV